MFNREAKRILIAEDDTEIRRLVTVILAREGYGSESVEDGAQAVERLRHEVFDVILLDLMMPEVSGKHVIDWMSENRPDLARHHVIVMTAAMDELKILDPSTVFATVAKPFDVPHLLQLVARCGETRVDAPEGMTGNG